MIKKPPVVERLAITTAFAKELRVHGPANFIYSDREYLYAHGHRRMNPATQRLDAPSLHRLHRRCPAMTSGDAEIRGLSISNDENNLTLLASVPLSGEPWQALDEGGEIVVVKDEKIIISPS